MHAVPALTDSDIAHKLACSNLVEPWLRFLAKEGYQSYVLDTLRYRFKLNDDVRSLAKCGDESTRDQLRLLVSSSSNAPAPQDGGIVALLAGIPGINSGEAVLFALAAEWATSTLITGDKNSLRALASTAQCAPLRTVLAGRLLCLEQVMARLIKMFGYEVVKSRVLSGNACDAVMRVAFGSGTHSTERSTMDALEYYYANLEKETNGLLQVTLV